MIDAGLPLVQCLEILANQQENKIFQAALRDIKAHVEAGRDLQRRARAATPRSSTSSSRTSSRPARWAASSTRILNRLAIYIEKNVKLVPPGARRDGLPAQRALSSRSASWPCCSSFVIPAFENMFKDFGAKDALPKLTQWVVAFSHGFVCYLPLIILVVIGTAVGFVYTYRTPAGESGRPPDRS